MRNYLIILLFILIFIKPQLAFAQSTYVLPYPGNMPGSIWYKLDQVKEGFDKYWYYGDLGQFKYNLKQSDKYLVEAKTLFDYKQYLLGFEALQKSDGFFKKVEPSLKSAKQQGKNISEKEKILKDAAAKHIEILTDMERIVPHVFNWTPEKDPATNLQLQKAIYSSINIRNLYD